MSTDATPSGRTPVTGEHRVAKLFGLEGDAWMRHATPLSVWTRFGVLPLRRELEPGLDRVVEPGPRRAVRGLHDGEPAAVPAAAIDPELGVQGRLR